MIIATLIVIKYFHILSIQEILNVNCSFMFTLQANPKGLSANCSFRRIKVKAMISNNKLQFLFRRKKASVLHLRSAAVIAIISTTKVAYYRIALQFALYARHKQIMHYAIFILTIMDFSCLNHLFLTTPCTHTHIYICCFLFVFALMAL